MLIVVILVSRLPIISGPYFQADGDESVLGLMAKDIADHNHFAVYFWGQQYGMVTFETGISALAFKIFGANVYALKLTMLFLWALGCLFLYQAVKKLFDFKAAVVFSMLLVSFQTWGIWAMQARGGYITAFFFSAFVAWMFAGIYKDPGKKWLAWVMIGLSMAVIYYAQKIWLLSLVAFLVYLIIKRTNIFNLVLMVAGFVAINWMIRSLSKDESSNYWGEYNEMKIYFMHNLVVFPKQIVEHLGGAWFFFEPLHAGIFNALAAYLWTIILFLLIGIQVYRILSMKFNGLSFLACISTLLVAAILFTNRWDVFNYRYLLPMDVPLVLWLCIEVYAAQATNKKPWLNTSYLAGIICLSGFAGMYQLRNISPGPVTEIPETSYNTAMLNAIHYLETQHVYYTFAQDAMVFWQTDFYSNERVLSRTLNAHDRKPDLVMPVTKAYNTGKPTALIDLYNSPVLNNVHPAPGIDPAKIISFGRQIKIYLNPEKLTLESMGFDLTDH